MAHSLAEHLEAFRCPGCKQTFPVDLWLVVDAAERPDLIAQLCAGQLGHLICLHCHVNIKSDMPLLLYRPGSDAPLLFAPPERIGKDRSPGFLSQMLERLRKSLGDEWQDVWEERLLILPRFALCAALTNELSAALRAYLQTRSRAEARQVLEACPVLLSDAAVVGLAEYGNNPRVRTNPEAVERLAQRRHLLDRCRAVGIPAAFAEVAGQLVQEIGRLADPALKVVKTREALTLIPRAENPGAWACFQALLGAALVLDTQGDQAAKIEQAISALTAALEEIKQEKDFLLWTETTLRLAIAFRLRLRDDRSGNLERALELYDRVLAELSPRQDRGWWIFAKQGLATTYRERLLGDRRENLKQAIQHGEEALREIEPNEKPPERAEILTALGNAHAEFSKLSAPEHLENAVTCYEQALEVQGVEPINQAAMLSNLANAYAEQARTTGGDEAKAVATYERALQLLSPETAPSEWALTLNNLAATYKKSVEGVRADNVERAIACYQQARTVFQPASYPDDCRRVAGDLALLYFERQLWPEAAEACQTALQAAEALYQSAQLPSSKQAELAATGDLYRRAAYALARTGQPQEAVLMLERGRARILNEALARDRADLTHAREQDPEAWKVYQWAAQQLRDVEEAERSEQFTLPLSVLPDSDRKPADDLRRARREALRKQAREARDVLNTAKLRFRRVPGLAEFPAEADFAEVSAAVSPGAPLVYLVATAAGSLALVLGREKEDAPVTVQIVRGDKFTTASLNELLELPEGQPDDEAETGDETGKGAEELLARQLEILPSLGRQFIGEVAAHLRQAGTRRVVLIPTGLLSLLPLQAASYQVDGGDHCLLDEFDVSYAPSARTLLAARAALAARPQRAPVLAGVGNPEPHPQPLAFARAELEEIAALFPMEARFPLYGQEASKHELLSRLPGASHVHLACHGEFDPDEPLNAHLQFADAEPLSLREILDQSPFGDARLVALSACETGLTEFRRLPDEAIGLPAGLLLAGTPGVVATLWAVNDLSTALLMIKFYELLLKGAPQSGAGPLLPAQALCGAQRWLRAVTADELFAYFQRHKMRRQPFSLTAAKRMPAEVADEGVLQFALLDKGRPPYEDPYFWAPFIFIGE